MLVTLPAAVSASADGFSDVRIFPPLKTDQEANHVSSSAIGVRTLTFPFTT